MIFLVEFVKEKGVEILFVIDLILDEMNIYVCDVSL